MAIEIRTAKSAEMEKNAAKMYKMNGGSSPKEDLGKVDWSKAARMMKIARLVTNLSFRSIPNAKGVKVEKLKLDGVPGEMSIPRKITSDNLILYIHGGGFISGSPTTVRAYCTTLAKFSGCRVVSIDYCLSPEHVWPSALEECVKAYLALRRRYPEAKVCLAGESAGGNLILCTTIRLIGMGEKRPECLLAHSPLGDFTFSLDRSYYEMNDDYTSIDGSKTLSSAYCPGQDLKNPEISPLFYDNFAALPPTAITCDYNEVLRADCDALHNKLAEAGVETQLTIMKNTFHAFAMFGMEAPETIELMIDNIRFMKKAWGELEK